MLSPRLAHRAVFRLAVLLAVVANRLFLRRLQRARARFRAPRSAPPGT